MLETIIAQIMAVVGPAIITAIGVIITWGLNELRKWLKGKTDSDTVDVAFKSLSKITQSAVISAEQSMKEYAEDGKITPSEALKIKRLVFQQIRSQIPKNTEKILKKVANSMDDLIDSKIEETVFFLKRRKK
jgi:hypothetical protein